MKKLSEILLERCTLEVQTPALHPTPALVLFGDVLDPDKLHDWLREEQYKTDVQGRAMLYPVKAKFEDWTLETHSDEYSGPLYIHVLSTDEAKLNILTITCQWYDGIFRNDYYVVGAILDADDLEKIKGKLK